MSFSVCVHKRDCFQAMFLHLKDRWRWILLISTKSERGNEGRCEIPSDSQLGGQIGLEPRDWEQFQSKKNRCMLPKAYLCQLWISSVQSRQSDGIWSQAFLSGFCFWDLTNSWTRYHTCRARAIPAERGRGRRWGGGRSRVLGGRLGQADKWIYRSPFSKTKEGAWSWFIHKEVGGIRPSEKSPSQKIRCWMSPLV